MLTNEVGREYKMCIDFNNLNTVLPKDCFPLPNIDQLVDAMASFEMMSFMNAYSNYHYIQMHSKDEEKMAFIMEEGTYCYIRKPFYLMNAGATYQRLVNRMFKNEIGQNMEVYVDDMMIKIKYAQNHISDLEEVFTIIRDYKIRLNPNKCVFGVTSKKFLSYLV